MSQRKTDYFGTFLDTLNAQRSISGTGLPTAPPATQQTQQAPATPRIPMDALVKVFPADPQATLSVIDVCKTFGASLDDAASALGQLEKMGLAENEKGQFRLTGVGREAASFSGR